MKQVVILLGAGSIGQAIARRVSTGKHLVLADYKLENAQIAAKIIGGCRVRMQYCPNGFEFSVIHRKYDCPCTRVR
jgi:saccharopine dehydrogenase-like NADP-dependent oxidoreductase